MLLLFNQLIRFVNGDIRSFFFARADCRTKSSGYAIISRPDIATVKDLKGKRLAINTFGSSADFAIYQLLSRNGLDPTPKRSSKNGFPWERLEQKKNHRQAATGRRLDVPKEPDADD